MKFIWISLSGILVLAVAFIAFVIANGAMVSGSRFFDYRMSPTVAKTEVSYNSVQRSEQFAKARSYAAKSALRFDGDKFLLQNYQALMIHLSATDRHTTVTIQSLYNDDHTPSDRTLILMQSSEPAAVWQREWGDLVAALKS